MYLVQTDFLAMHTLSNISTLQISLARSPFVIAARALKNTCFYSLYPFILFNLDLFLFSVFFWFFLDNFFENNPLSFRPTAL